MRTNMHKRWKVKASSLATDAKIVCIYTLTICLLWSESVVEFINFVSFVAWLLFTQRKLPVNQNLSVKITWEDSVLLLVTRPYDRGDKSKTHGWLTHNWFKKKIYGCYSLCTLHICATKKHHKTQSIPGNRSCLAQTWSVHLAVVCFSSGTFPINKYTGFYLELDKKYLFHRLSVQLVCKDQYNCTQGWSSSLHLHKWSSTYWTS